MGFRVLEAGGAEDALSQLEHGVDVLVSDIVMPGGSGPDLVRGARAKGYDGPVLFIPGFSGHAAAQDPLLEEVELLTKPFEAELLAAKLVELMPAKVVRLRSSTAP
jgi:two-component system cell cycle sensor histidine kinase/response regulator CckA